MSTVRTILNGASRTRRIVLILGIVAALVATSLGIAFAYWTSQGTGSGSGTTGTLSAPTNVAGSSTPGSGTAAVTWAASAGPLAPTGYYATRTNSSNVTTAACNTSPTTTIAGTSCTDASVPIGTYTYKVTAIYHSWTATSAASGSVTLAQGAQTITFTSTAPVGAIVGGSTYSVTATGGASGNALTFSIDGTSAAVCSIAGSTVSFTAVGTCTINANQAGNTNYLAAPQKQQSFAVGQGAQAITFTSTVPSNASVGGSTYSVTATGGGSGNPVTFTIDSSATSFCSITGSTVSFTAVGTCKVNANQAGNANYLAAGQAQQSFAVAKGAQTITFTSTTPAAATVGSTTYTVTATGGASGNAVTFTVDATSSSVCTIAGSTVSFTGVGTCTIDANQATSTNYLVASQVQQSFAVGQGAQAITFTSTMPASATVGGTPYTVTATASSGLAVALTLDATSTGCSLSGSTSGSTVSFPAAGTCKIDANQAGNANYLPAGQLQQSFSVAAASQTITFTSTPASPMFGGGAYTVTATGGASGNPVTFTSATTSVCTVSGSTVTYVAAGTCTVNANQAGNGNYNAALPAPQTFTVAKANQTITFTSTAPAAAKVGGSTYAATATGGGSGNPVTFTSATTSVCTVATATVTFVGAGTCTINANQAFSGNYNAAPQVQQTFTVAKADQAITFTSTAPTGATVGGPTYTAAATATSGLSVTFTSATTAVCTVSGTTVTFVSAGTCTINANQSGNGNYNPAPQVQQSFIVVTLRLCFVSTTGTTCLSGTQTVGNGGSFNGRVQLVDASNNPVIATAAITVSLSGSGDLGVPSPTSVVITAGASVSATFSDGLANGAQKSGTLTGHTTTINATDATLVIHA